MHTEYSVSVTNGLIHSYSKSFDRSFDVFFAFVSRLNKDAGIIVFVEVAVGPHSLMTIGQ